MKTITKNAINQTIADLEEILAQLFLAGAHETALNWPEYIVKDDLGDYEAGVIVTTCDPNRSHTVMFSWLAEMGDRRAIGFVYSAIESLRALHDSQQYCEWTEEFVIEISRINPQDRKRFLRSSYPQVDFSLLCVNPSIVEVYDWYVDFSW